MADTDARLAGLSPERRLLLKRLAAARSAAAAALPDEARIDAERFRYEGTTSHDQALVQRFYDAVSRQLDASPFADHAQFLNYGYVANDNAQSARLRPPPGHPNRNSVRLVLELIGDTPIGPTDDVLDVGCGRGGTAAVIRELFPPRLMVGIDLSPTAIAFCRRTQVGDNVRFLTASADALPLPSERFDVVTNVESSHSYARLGDFLAEVHRVLRPGGVFLYTDVIAREEVATREADLAALGFTCERTQDITSNVLLSCDETAATRVRAFHRESDPALMDAFLGVPSSILYEAMKDGSQRYLIYRWRKPAEKV